MQSPRSAILSSKLRQHRRLHLPFSDIGVLLGDRQLEAVELGAEHFSEVVEASLVNAADDLHGFALRCTGRFELAGPFDGAATAIGFFAHMQVRSIARDGERTFKNGVGVAAGVFVYRFEPFDKRASAMEVTRSDPGIAALALFAP